ncbi:MAG: hypothetical protein J6R63_05705, partial [Kiritimatiellae bacterium]|nr:hypothetical protein [Kiritimatiellia bacterium]
SIKIADYDGVSKVSGISSAYDKLVELVKEAASGTPQKIDSSKRLAELMAGKARLLQRNAAKFLSPLTKAYDAAPVGAKPPVTPILELLLGMRDVLMPNVGADEFSDIFAQTLTYGMFAARLNDPTPETFTRYEAMGLIPKTNPFLKQFFSYVANNLEEELEWMVDDLADLFRAADVEKIMRGYGRTGADPMIHFYEDFLAAYDAGLRKDRGVWYTPIQVVKFIVGAADWALRTRFNLADGLADRSKTEIQCEEVAPYGKKMTKKVKKSVHRVQLLDPATGTGTFIAEAIRQIAAKFKGNEGMWPGYVESDLLPRLNGFELLMASYTMAHIKIDFALRETLGKCCQCDTVANSNSQFQLKTGNTGNGNTSTLATFPQFKQRFNVFLTDSLSDWHKELPGGLFASALAPEQQGADEVKRDTPVMVVIGNPPYSGISQNNGEWISKLVDDYKVEPGGKIKLQERKHWLNDDYVKFIRLAEHYVEKTGEGIVAYITPHGFLDNPTFRGMRWHLMQTFDEIWTLNLHGNSKKKEVAPDGGKDECVFNIMQGVAITLFVKKGNCEEKGKLLSLGALRLLRSSRTPSCDFASQSSSRCSSGDLTTLSQVYLALTQPDACGAGESLGDSETRRQGEDSEKSPNLPNSQTPSNESNINPSRTKAHSREANNCRVYYADLWGKKKEKLAALDEATMDSIEWQELKPTEPMLFFTPRDKSAEAVEDDWNDCFGIAELMKITSSGIVSMGDSFAYSDSRDEVESKLLDLKKNEYKPADLKRKYSLGKNYADFILKYNHSSFDKMKIMEAAYRPFEKKWTYFNGDVLWRTRYAVLRHLTNSNNVGLCLIKICSRDDDLPVFVTDKITDKTILSSKDNANVFPLYLYEENMGKVEKRANLDKDIVAKIAEILNPVNPVNPVKETPSPEDIFDYIYGVLHSPSYRTKFKEFLKVDFPRIPYPKDAAEFARFRDAGRELRAVHLMKDAEPSLSEARGRFPIAGDNVVEVVKWDNGRVYINSSQYFDNVPLEAWEQAIGGYRPAEKYLKDRKNRALSQE